MDIVNFTKKMHQLELENDFFNIKDNNGLVYWDIVRHDVFYAIYYELADIKPGAITASGSFSKIKSIFKNILYGTYSKFKLKPHKNLFFVSSRYKNEQNENVDYAISDILEVFKDDDALIMDSVVRFGQAYRYNCIFNLGVVIALYKSKLVKKRKAVQLFEISTILSDHFGLNTDLNKTISVLIERYELEYKYYKKLLKTIKPQQIFLVQNGIQKALFTVANELHIPLYEMQHGLVSFIHPAYDYPKTINYTHLNSFPKYFLTFSDFWSNNINYPVEKIITVGNSFFARKLSATEKRFDLTFISADIYSYEINSLIKGLLESGYLGNIALKLHPNQYAYIEGIKKEFTVFSNLTIVYDELTIKGILQLSSCVLAVQSTCVYEALDNNVKVLIYKIKDYRTHEDVFENANVYRIDGFQEIDELLSKDYIKSNEITFFESFNKNTCLDFIQTT